VPHITPLTVRKRGFRVPAAGPAIVFVGGETSGDKIQPTTLVDIRGLNLSDAGSIPAIST